jgi:hypothetical protein
VHDPVRLAHPIRHRHAAPNEVVVMLENLDAERAVERSIERQRRIR